MSRRRWWVAVPTGILLVVLLAVLGVSALRPAGPGDLAGTGRPAPDFVLPKLDGTGTLRLADLRGRPVVLNFWASWCAECRDEFSLLREAWPRYRQRDFVFVAVAFQDTVASAAEFMRQENPEWPAVLDGNSRAALSFGVRGIPQTYFVDRAGRIDHVQRGTLTRQSLSAHLNELDRGQSG
ncbi:TlpA family protein disulfide reductase [Amycolatopsis sp. NBC_00345]|uniref:TlpA family protein disulfide reductase n=1 Tax=Amycolatopsis sp. NBC_00345 TaxID=2975955 RepID=UPI002E265FE9